VRVVGNVTDFSQGSIIANPSGLVAASGAEYTAGPNSGLGQTGSPDQGGYGSLYPGTVEMSNTDIGGNQIDLMLASNQFRANLQVVRTAEDLLGELMNLRRPS